MIRRSFLALATFGMLAGLPAFAQVPSVVETRQRPVVARDGMVASQDKFATRIGVDILARGGNAVDAAVAVGFAMAVTHPQAGNLGGGGFMLVHLAERNQTVAIDYRESAPAATTRDVFLDAAGNADPQKSRDTGLAVGVPGTVAGLALALERYGSGKFTLSELIAPAVDLARAGIPVEDDLADSLARFQPRLVRWPSTAKIFLKPDGVALGAGDRLVQSDLADTLATIAQGGPRAFYDSEIAERIVAGVRTSGGQMSRDDLRHYQPIVREPVRGSYRGFEIASMPPPSSGGVHLVQILNILEGYQLRERDASALHLMIEAMKPAYADRAEYLGDPETVKVPVKGLTAKAYATDLRAQISTERARPAQEIKPGRPQPFESPNTTHYSVTDRFGNAVSNTYTLNFSYGVGMVAEGTGILLNNELDDFAAKPGVPNAYGLVGGDANAPGPGKRPLSSMTPTILFRDGRVVMVTGSPGGSRIITTVLQVITNVVDFRMSLADAVAAPRLHHQWLPDQVVAERGLAAEIVQALEARGHNVALGPNSGSANSILVTPEGFVGAADPRTRGALAAGP